jgi:hypothetical protein
MGIAQGEVKTLAPWVPDAAQRERVHASLQKHSTLLHEAVRR